jgi:peptidoglycan/LPS O-acetylase OafA/YrhL
MTSIQNRSFGLDFARSVAIFLVVLSHFAHTDFAILGFWGVELFFALSGYLIGQILWRNFSAAAEWKFSNIFNFWSRRWWRTLPNYYLFLALMIVFTIYTQGKLPGLPGIFKFIWFGQYLFNGNLDFFPVSWSLCIEEWFYMLFPLVLFVSSKIGFKKRGSFIVTLLVFFAGSLLVRFMLASNGMGFAIKTTTLARLDSIACGVMIAYLTTVIKWSHTAKLISFIGGAVLFSSPLFVAMFFKKDFNQVICDPTILLCVPMGFAFVLPLINLLQVPKGVFSFLSSYIRNLSLWSYSLYLIHLPLMFLMYSAMAGMRDNIYINFFSKIFSLLISVVLSYLLFRFYEVPFTKKRPNEINN